jgi:hypothetical protein
MCGRRPGADGRVFERLMVSTDAVTAVTWSGQTLANALLQQAIWTENRLDRGLRAGVAQQEETITESNLLSLTEALPQLDIKVYTRREEGRSSGADWVWWWRGRDVWFGGLVQAKKLKGRGAASYYDIGYTPKSKEGAPMRQVDRLLLAGERARLPTMYALYNCSIPNERRSGHCPYGLQGTSAEGVTTLDARVARLLLDQPRLNAQGKLLKASRNLKLSDAHSWARPWSCLATCSSAGCATWPVAARELWEAAGMDVAPDKTDLAAQAAFFALRAAAQVRQAQFRKLQQGVEESLLQYVANGLRHEPPVYIRDPGVLTTGSWDADGDGELTPGDVNTVISIEPAAQPNI